MNKKHILVVEDEAPIRFAACKILRKAGYIVSEASDGRQARLMVLSAHQSQLRFDLILLDIQMPNVCGDQLFMELVQLDFCPPMLLMTGGTRETQLDFIKDNHYVELILKPFDSVALLESVAHALSKPSK